MKDDRLQRMMDDPEKYMAEARQRAREAIERDMERDRRRKPVRRKRMTPFQRDLLGAVVVALLLTVLALAL